MKYYFFGLSLVLLFNNFLVGTVVFLHGTSCAGKTSLCHELVRQSSEWQLVSEDDIFYEQAAIRWKREYPVEFQAIEKAIDAENLLHAVMRNQILFRTDACDSQRAQAKLAISIIQESLNGRVREIEQNDPASWNNLLRKTITQIIKDAAKTHHVIVETWFLKEEHIHEIEELYEVLHAVAYCPFLDMVKRIMKRNYAALMGGKDISSMRFFHQPLNSFTRIYDITDVADGAIDRLNVASIIHGCDLVSMCLNDSSCATGATKTFTRGEFSLREFEEYRQALLAAFVGHVSYLHPKRMFDVIIRTDQGTAAQCAQVLVEMVSSR